MLFTFVCLTQFEPKWSDFGDAVALDYIRDAKTNPDGYWWDTMKVIV